MRLLMSYIFTCSLLSSMGQKQVHIYLAHCDSLFYVEAEKFDATKINWASRNDSAFINGLFNRISPSTHILLFKPYTDVCIDDGMAPLLLNWKTFFEQRGFGFEVRFTEKDEDRYFKGVSVKQFVANGYQDTPSSGSSRSRASSGSLPPPPPPPPAPIVTRDGKAPPGSAPGFYVAAKNVVTFIFEGDVIYYYEGFFKGTLLKTDYSSVGNLIQQYKKKIGAKKMILFIKEESGSFRQNKRKRRSLMSENDIPPGYYVEEEISKKEKEGINKINKNK